MKPLTIITKTAIIASISTLAFFNVFCYGLYRYVDPGQAEGVNRVCSDKVKRTIHWMGNKKNYQLMPDGQLQVKVNGKYLNLRYKP